MWCCLDLATPKFCHFMLSLSLFVTAERVIYIYARNSLILPFFILFAISYN